MHESPLFSRKIAHTYLPCEVSVWEGRRRRSTLHTGVCKLHLQPRPSPSIVALIPIAHYTCSGICCGSMASLVASYRVLSSSLACAGHINGDVCFSLSKLDSSCGPLFLAVSLYLLFLIHDAWYLGGARRCAVVHSCPCPVYRGDARPVRRNIMDK